MKLLPQLFIITTIVISACQSNTPKTSNEDSTFNNESLEIAKADTIEKVETQEMKASIALSANAIQIVNQTSGSTQEITFGMPIEQMVEIIENVLKSKPTVNINIECGAGPLKFATWDDGLTLLFQEKKKNKWIFAGWAANASRNSKNKLTTMANIGVGSTRKELESAYEINVSKTSLGYEFSTKTEDLFGIIDGGNENSKITNMWSGMSCNFR